MTRNLLPQILCFSLLLLDSWEFQCSATCPSDGRGNMKVRSCSRRLKELVNLRYVKSLWVPTCLKRWASKNGRHLELAPSTESEKQLSGRPSLTVFPLPSVHSAALEMELLPLWLCLGFHFLTVEWRTTRSGVATAACQRCCKSVSFPRNSELSIVPVLTGFGPFGKLGGCQSRRAGNEWIRITLHLPSMMPCATCS